MTILEVTMKLLLAVALGGIVGLERESSQKPAGFRTNILICVGSTMMMILSGLLLQGRESTAIDLTRIAAGVITGIGFIGAGTIIQARGSIMGLTTAASLWAMAGLGLVIGAGYYLIAVIFTAVVLLILVIFGKVEDLFLRKSTSSYHLKAKHSREILATLKKLALHEGIRFNELTLRKEGHEAVIDFSFQATHEKEQKFNQSLLDLGEISEIRID